MRNPGDIFTEPSNIDVNTLKNLGPLSEMAGIWEGSRSLDIPPKQLSAPVRQAFVEHTELQPIDPQANGPQLFYGLRYHTHIVKPGGRDLPRSGGLLVVGAGHRQRDSDHRHSARTDRHGLWARCPRRYQFRVVGRARSDDERDLLESVSRGSVQDPGVSDQGGDQVARRLDV